MSLRFIVTPSPEKPILFNLDMTPERSSWVFVSESNSTSTCILESSPEIPESNLWVSLSSISILESSPETPDSNL